MILIQTLGHCGIVEDTVIETMFLNASGDKFFLIFNDIFLQIVAFIGSAVDCITEDVSVVNYEKYESFLKFPIMTLHSNWWGGLG